jgi:hypothetical protein
MLRSWGHTLDSVEKWRETMTFITNHRDAGKADLMPQWLRNVHQQSLVHDASSAAWSPCGGEGEMATDEAPSDEGRDAEAALAEEDFEAIERAGLQD